MMPMLGMSGVRLTKLPLWPAPILQKSGKVPCCCPNCHLRYRCFCYLHRCLIRCLYWCYCYLIHCLCCCYCPHSSSCCCYYYSCCFHPVRCYHPAESSFEASFSILLWAYFSGLEVVLYPGYHQYQRYRHVGRRRGLNLSFPYHVQPVSSCVRTRNRRRYQ